MSRGTDESVQSHGVDLVGAAEAAELLNVPRSSVARWLKQGRFPRPLAVLRATPVWRRDDIQEFAAKRKPRERDKIAA
jgi:predicted DNA-binding transcriptional regulator AlpA